MSIKKYNYIHIQIGCYGEEDRDAGSQSWGILKTINKSENEMVFNESLLALRRVIKKRSVLLKITGILIEELSKDDN